MKAFPQGGGFSLKSKMKNIKDVWERQEITAFYLFKIAYNAFKCIIIHIHIFLIEVMLTVTVLYLITADFLTNPYQQT